ncbi:MAG: chromosome segregation protein SMC [Opitutaceae bacterium]|nr:chromosome segregation protein SMC [Opitutaceae bacterium]
MHLRALKLNGFKSFADPTELKFDRGVTAIVGPNGCGKSNIADAIRWVLGEQSAKALRGGKMQDVIFEGTDNRKPVQICEVSLLLTECEEKLGTEFHEVEITRRVSRDGVGEYFINGRACRLKDIQKLFMDTGVGRTSYSIMAQGQIDQILSSKPEERRAVFEEAAGITKYKSQRREALAKLGLVDQNLSRVTDVINEVARQIGSLKRQASKALRFKRLNHKLRHLDLAQGGRTYETLNLTVGDLDSQLGARSGEVRQFASDLEHKESELTTKKAQRGELLQRVQEAQQAVFDLKSQREAALNQAHLNDIRRNGLEERIVQAKDDLTSIQTQLSELAQRADSSTQDKQLQLSILGDSDEVFQDRNRELNEVEARLTGSEQELQQLKYRTLEAESALVRLRNDCTNLEVEDRAAQARTERLREEFAEQEAAEARVREALASVHEQVEAARQRQAEAQQGVVDAQQAIHALGLEFKEAQRKITELDRQLAQKTARLKLLQQLQEKLEGFGEGAKALMQGRLGGVFGDRRFAVLSQGLKVRSEYARPVETLLGAAVEAVLVEDGETARLILDRLAELKLGRACLRFPTPPRAFAPPAELPATIRPAIDALEIDAAALAEHPVAGVLTGCYVAQTAADFLSYWQANPSLEFVFAATPAGELIDRRGLVFGGQRKSGGGILQRAAELKEIEGEIAAEQAALATARSQAEAVGMRLAEAEGALEDKRSEQVEATRQAGAVAAEERNAQRAVQEAEMRRAKLEREREGIEETHRRATERAAQARVEFEQGEAKLNSLRARMDEIDRGLAMLRGERDIKREAVTQARFDLAEKRQRLEVLNRGLSEIEQRRSALVQAQRTRESEIESWSAQIGELGVGAEAQRSRADECARTLVVAQESVQAIRQELVQLEEVLGVLEKELSYLRTQSESLRSEASKLQVDLAEKRARLQFLQEEAQREHGMDLRTVEWRYEMWMAGQQPEGLRPLDLDEDEDSKDDTAKAEKPKATAPETTAAAVEGQPAADGQATAAPAASATPAKKQPTHEELAALENTDWEAVKNEVLALRQRLQGMGPVNLVAIEEYGELKQRYEFLKAQCDDLTNSKAALLKAIDEINQTSEKQFAETFQQIRKNFAQTFNTLFGGGHADLQLVDHGDVLESGIEIVAQPPATRLKSITLLSGGQKTMTAVGLLFAIYMVKPSPFCVLDELDAPLDESNIGRFTNLLRQFTSASQFIIITHNKRTIAASQSIYGVTMEERGVSKVVSMRFHTDHQEADMVKLNIAGRLEAPRVQEAETPAAPGIAPEGASAALGDGPAVAVAEAPATTIVAASDDPVSAVETNGHAAEPAPESEPRRPAGEPGDN